MKKIYVIGERDKDVLKIGISDKPARRLDEIRALNPYDVELLWERAIAGARGIEMAVHLIVSPRRVRGEWFRISLPEAINVIEAVIAKEDEIRVKAQAVRMTRWRVYPIEPEMLFPDVARLRHPRI